MSSWVPQAVVAGALVVGTLVPTFMRRYYYEDPDVIAIKKEDQILENALDSVLSEIQAELPKKFEFYDLIEVTDEIEATNGFKRPEFQTFRQNITLDVEGAKKNTNSNISEAESTRLVEHDKHIFILTNKRSTEWEKDILRKGFPAAVTSAFNKVKKDLKVKVSVAEASANETISDETAGLYDIIVLPDCQKYSGIKENELEAFASAVAGKTENVFDAVPVDGSHIFVCCHVKRHASIEACGPRIFKALVEAAEKKSNVTIRRVTELGGFNHETNVIVYDQVPMNKEKKCFGDWYWNIGLNDVSQLLDNLGKNKIIIDRWRGRCGMKASTVHSFLKFQIINQNHQ